MSLSFPRRRESAFKQCNSQRFFLLDRFNQNKVLFLTNSKSMPDSRLHGNDRKSEIF